MLRYLLDTNVTNQLVLVTFNTSDYSDFAGLTLVDWRV
jgi:predicted nucleic acid-binding protein